MKPYEWIAYLVANAAPEPIIGHVRQMLTWAGMQQDPREWLGSTLLLSWLCGIIVLLWAWVIVEITNVWVLLGAGFGALVIVFFVFYLLLLMRVEDRRKRVERSLPDAIQMVAANIRAGVNPVIALRMAARPEFGPLEEEIRIATARALGTESFGEALAEMGARIRSEVLDRTIGLFASSMRAGGNLAALLENTASEIIEAQELRRELIAGTNMYVVFIIFTMVVGMPLLLAVSIQFVGMTESLQAKGSAGAFAQDLGIAVKSPVSASFIEGVAFVSLLVTALMASMLVGVIHDGSEWYGMRLAPIFASASLVMFYLLKDYVLKSLLASV